MFNHSPLRISVVALFCLLFSESLLAQTAAHLDESCALSGDDFEVASRISESSKKFSGQCMDSDRFRPAVITQDDEDALVFQNYFHQDTYWKASLPKDAKIKASYVQVVRFSIVSGVTAAHVQFRAVLEDETPLVIESPSQSLNVNDIVVSFEAARPKEVSYNFALGAVDNYVLVGRVASGEQRLKEYGDEYKTEQYELNLSAEESLELLLAAIQQSHESQVERFYNTLKPNCTTEIFDLIDQLPSQAFKGNEAFLTVISNDPVAGPTIEGLEDRGLLKRRFADLGDEFEGKTRPPQDKMVQAQFKILSEVEGYPYSVVLMTSEGVSSSSLIKEAKSMAYSLAPQIIQRLGASLMMSENMSTALLSSLKDLGPLLKENLNQINSDLGSEPLSLALYLSPWDAALGRRVDIMKELDVPARLPFETYETQFKFRSLNEIHVGFNDAKAEQSQSPNTFGLVGVLVQLHLVKNRSDLRVQVVGNLNPLQKVLSVKNDQVRITKFLIPERHRNQVKPVALITLSQNVQEPLPRLKVEFGAFGGLVQDLSSPLLGTAKLEEEDDCRNRSFSVPSMFGKAVAAKELVDVWMDIFSVEFDLEKQNVKHMDVRVTSGIAGWKTGVIKRCESDPEINKQFSDNANAQLQSQKDNLASSPGLSLLNELLSNNKEQTEAGFQ